MQAMPLEQRHLEQGERTNRFGCPVALALQESGQHCAEVSLMQTTLGPADNRARLVNSQTVRDFITDYDAGRPVKVPARLWIDGTTLELTYSEENPETSC